MGEVWEARLFPLEFLHLVDQFNAGLYVLPDTSIQVQGCAFIHLLFNFKDGAGHFAAGGYDFAEGMNLGGALRLGQRQGGALNFPGGGEVAVARVLDKGAIVAMFTGVGVARPAGRRAYNWGQPLSCQ